MPIILDGTAGVTLDGSAGVIISENVKTGNTTAAIADLAKVIAMNNTSAATITIPNDSTVNFPIGSIIRICRINTGSVTLAGASGVTLSRVGNFGANEEVSLRKRAANNWIVVDIPQNPSATGGTITLSGGNRIHTFTTVGAGTFTAS
jgi:hypothetical protein